MFAYSFTVCDADCIDDGWWTVLFAMIGSLQIDMSYRIYRLDTYLADAWLEVIEALFDTVFEYLKQSKSNQSILSFNVLR